MSQCAVCKKTKTERCEDGWIVYPVGDFCCPFNPAHVTSPPRLREPVDEWTWEPAPTKAGLEDLF